MFFIRSNNGAVDATIDQLLTMTADLEEDKPPPLNTPSPPDYLANPPTYNQALRYHLLSLKTNFDPTLYGTYKYPKT